MVVISLNMVCVCVFVVGSYLIYEEVDVWAAIQHVVRTPFTNAYFSVIT